MKKSICAALALLIAALCLHGCSSSKLGENARDAGNRALKASDDFLAGTLSSEDARSVIADVMDELTKTQGATEEETLEISKLTNAVLNLYLEMGSDADPDAVREKQKIVRDML